MLRWREAGGQYADRRSVGSVARLEADAVIAVLDVAERLAWADTLVGFRYQVSFVLPAVAPLVVGLALNRGDRDFSDAECEQLDLLRPHLEAALRRVRKHDPLAHVELTERQRQVACLVGEGLTNGAIGERLGIAPGTVKKHLEHVYAAAGVPNRAALARMAGTPGER